MNDLNAIQARADAGTPGPWIVGYSMGAPLCVHTQPPPDNAPEIERLKWARNPCNTICSIPAPRHREDATFIAHARGDVPALVAELRAARDLIEPLRVIVVAYKGLPSSAWPEGLADAARALAAYDKTVGAVGS